MKIRISFRRAIVACASFALLGLSLQGRASAGMILDTPAPAVSGPGLGFAAVPAVVTLNPNNDNQTLQSADGPLDNNVLVPLKRFDSSEPIDIVFSVTDTQGVTEYKVSEFVDNNTGVDWIGYRMELGFGVGAGFTKLTGDGLDFDAPTFDPPPSSLPFPTIVAADEDTLSFSGGIHGAGAQLYRFRIDVPDLSTRLPPDVGTFTLRQVPIPIPEPASVILIGLATAAFALLRRR